MPQRSVGVCSDWTICYRSYVLPVTAALCAETPLPLALPLPRCCVPWPTGALCASQVSTTLSPTNKYATIGPLSLVLAFTMIKEAVEDYVRPLLALGAGSRELGAG